MSDAPRFRDLLPAHLISIAADCGGPHETCPVRDRRPAIFKTFAGLFFPDRLVRTTPHPRLRRRRDPPVHPRACARKLLAAIASDRMRGPYIKLIAVFPPLAFSDTDASSCCARDTPLFERKHIRVLLSRRALSASACSAIGLNECSHSGIHQPTDKAAAIGSNILSPRRRYRDTAEPVLLRDRMLHDGSGPRPQAWNTRSASGQA